MGGTHNHRAYGGFHFRGISRAWSLGVVERGLNYPHLIEHLSTEIWEDQEGTIIFSTKTPI